MTERQDLLARFAWIDGHADVWRLFDDGQLFERLTDALAEPFVDAGVTKVAGVEARGFILGAAVALRLRAGFVAIRKAGGLLPGPKAEERAGMDYRGHEHVLRLQRRALGAGDRVLLVDDWAERGSQAVAARTLVERCGADFLGLAVLVDELEEGFEARLRRVHRPVRADELGSSA